MAEVEEESGVEDVSVEDTLESLKRNAKAVEVHLLESLQQMKKVQRGLAEESKNIEVPLQPKTKLMKWLTDRGLKVESTFQEFFEVFVEEHKLDSRLDLSTRTIELNSAACMLFGLKQAHSKLHIYDLLEKIMSLYYER
jgi:hypothetical protein